MVRILIVGGGVAGLATAWSLARRGERDVVLLEREERPCLHASGQNAAILRTLSGDALSSAFARASADFLCAPPPGFSEVPLVRATGLLLSADGHRAADLEGWFESSGGSHGGLRISRARVHELAPRFDAEIGAAFWFPKEGVIDIAALTSGFERGARAAGIAIETGARVEALWVENDRVRGARLASGESLEADWTVIAAGGWAGELGRAAGSRMSLTPTRRHLVATTSDPAVDPRGPVVWHHALEPFYARPERGGLLACALDQTKIDPNLCRADPSVRGLVLERVSRYLPGVADRARSFWAGMRTFAADQRFAIGPDPDRAGLFWVAGLGGHGMVCAHGVGELAAARLLGARPTTAAARAFDPGRRLGASAGASAG